MKINFRIRTAVPVEAGSQPLNLTSRATRTGRPGDLVSLNPQPLPPRAVFANAKDGFSAPKVKGAASSPEAPLRSGAELDMIELQSLVSKRSSELAMTNGLMSALSQAMKDVAKNIGDGGGGNSGGDPSGTHDP